MTTLNVEPGGTEPASARSKARDVGRLTAASTSPVDTRTATMAAGCCTPASALSAARCTPGSMVVTTGRAGRPPAFAIVATWKLPDGSTTESVVVGSPASWVSYAASIPLWPTWLAAVYGAPSRFSCSAVMGPTVPTTWAPRSAVRGARPVLFWKAVPGSG